MKNEKLFGLKEAISLVGFLSLIFLSGPESVAYKVKPPYERFPAKIKKFICAPAKLFRGDSLRIEMDVPHGRDLGIWDPDGLWVFISFWRHDKESPAQPLVGWEEFQNMDVLEIHSVETKAPRMEEGLEPPTRVFRKTGRYIVLLGKNLETHNSEKTVNRCEVYYVNEVKPSHGRN